MSKYHVFVSQTGSHAPAALDVTGTYIYWVNASGNLMVTLNDLTSRQATTNFSTSGTREAVSTGQFLMTTVGNVGTGIIYGTTGTNLYPTFLGQPNMWIKAWGPNGELLSIPTYTRTS